jgi:hypothetical protein
MAITTAASLGLVGNGDYPQINRGVAYDVPHFYSDGFPNASTMLVSVKMKAGFGWIEQGTVIAEDANGEFVPYVPTTYSDNVAVSPVLSDVALNATTLTVSELESGKYAVGDVLVLADAHTTPVYFDAGAITDISVANGIATITFTNATTVDTFTTARSAHVYVKTGTSGKFSTAKFIIDKPVDTGVGSAALGAQCSAIVKNAVIYSAPLFNLDTAAKTALGVVSYGNRAFI